MVHVFKMDALLILSVKTVMLLEEFKSVFNALFQPTEFLLFLNMFAYVNKVSMITKEFANPAHLVALNALMQLFVKDVLFQLPTILTELALALKAITLLLNH